MAKRTYELIDSGNQRKLERFGSELIARPCSQAVWKPSLSETEWAKATTFTREKGNKWSKRLSSWECSVDGIKFKLQPTGFGHLGVFPEHAQLWNWMAKQKAKRVLNLFAYTGGATLALAKSGAEVTHVDASKTSVAWAKENASLNELTDAPIRWIVDDAVKFLQREKRRGITYEGILLDPPSFGRGKKGELFKLEFHLISLLELCKSLLSPKARFFILSSHTPGMTPIAMHNLMSQVMDGSIEAGELTLQGNSALPIPSGSFVRWSCT